MKREWPVLGKLILSTSAVIESTIARRSGNCVILWGADYDLARRLVNVEEETAAVVLAAKKIAKESLVCGIKTKDRIALAEAMNALEQRTFAQNETYLLSRAANKPS